MSRTVRLLATSVLVVALAGCSGGGDEPATPSSNAALVPSSAAPLPDSQRDQVFVSTLAQQSLTVPNPAVAGAVTCGGFDRGIPAPTILSDLQQVTRANPDDAGFILGAAVSVYCPQHLEQLRASIG